MPYASELESRIAKKVTKAITEFGLIDEGDRIMIGLSGGKDSWALIQILDVLKRRAPIDFSFVAVNIGASPLLVRLDFGWNRTSRGGKLWPRIR